jgi:hypothetical protein
VAGGNYGKYNTTGVLKGPSGASGAKADEASPEIVVTAAEISKLDALQMLLDVVGLIPGLGAPADILNAIISGARGDWLGAALSLFGAVPVAGEAATAGKIAKNSEKYAAAVAKVADEVLPYLPKRVQDKLRPAIDAAKKKIDELGGKKPTAEPEAPPKAQGGPEDGQKVKPKKRDPCSHPRDGNARKYVVYMADEFDATGKKVGTYVGRTSGAPGQSTNSILAKRKSNHHRSNLGPLVSIFETSSYAAVRGAEHILKEKLGTADQINPVGPRNERRQDYLDCAKSKGIM